MKKARANTNDYWDKKLLEVEEKDPNRWRHTGYKKMYIQGDSSSGESDREGGFRYNAAAGGAAGGSVGGLPPNTGRYARSRSPRSRSRSRLRKSPPMSPHMRRRSPPMDMGGRRISPPMDGMRGRPRSPPPRGGIPPRSPSDMGRGRMPLLGGAGGNNRPRSPPEPPMRRKPSRSPLGRRRSPPSMSRRRSPPPVGPNKRGQILPRSKRPPSPPPRVSYLSLEIANLICSITLKYFFYFFYCRIRVVRVQIARLAAAQMILVRFAHPNIIIDHGIQQKQNFLLNNFI